MPGRLPESWASRSQKAAGSDERKKPDTGVPVGKPRAMGKERKSAAKGAGRAGREKKRDAGRTNRRLGPGQRGKKRRGSEWRKQKDDSYPRKSAIPCGKLHRPAGKGRKQGRPPADTGWGCWEVSENR